MGSSARVSCRGAPGQRRDLTPNPWRCLVLVAIVVHAALGEATAVMNSRGKLCSYYFASARDFSPLALPERIRLEALEVERRRRRPELPLDAPPRAAVADFAQQLAAPPGHLEAPAEGLEGVGAHLGAARAAAGEEPAVAPLERARGSAREAGGGQEEKGLKPDADRGAGAQRGVGGAGAARRKENVVHLDGAARGSDAPPPLAPEDRRVDLLYGPVLAEEAVHVVLRARGAQGRSDERAPRRIVVHAAARARRERMEQPHAFRRLPVKPGASPERDLELLDEVQQAERAPELRVRPGRGGVRRLRSKALDGALPKAPVPRQAGNHSLFQRRIRHSA
mmetsp:Transcript_41305/g.129380  ORF Transcript_41305/g.129380 Transcript_41305/m.129380 type:complete len:337 (+) Transcript_41305:354-1364(+)